jgi:predicted phosphodiesterase
MTMKKGRPRAKVTLEMIETELAAPNNLTVTQIAEKYGVSRDTIERRMKLATPAAKKSSAKPEPVKEVSEKQSKIHLLSQAVGDTKVSRYVYNEKTDTYVTFLRNAPEPVVVSGTTHRDMAKAYSNWDGAPASVNEMCRTFTFPRPWFAEYKTIHGWTHDKEPFSAEELMTRPVEELIETALQMRRQALSQGYEIEKWKETQSDADKYRDLQHNVVAPFMEHIERFAPSYRPPMLSMPKIQAAERFALIVSPTDLHFGKVGWTDAGGQTYSKVQTEQLLIDHTSRLLEQVARHGRPEVIFVPVGSDWFHVDNLAASTTALTPQDLDGLPENMIFEGNMLAVKHIDLLRQIGPVCLIACPGNHDYQNSLSLLHFLKAWYRNDSDVEVRVTTDPRQYALYGNTLMGFAHGNDEKVTMLPGLMAGEARNGWGASDFQYFFTGHLHHEVSREIDGIIHHQIPSLSPADRWHAKKGYVLSRRALHAHKVSFTEGINALFISSVIEKSPSRSLNYGFKLPHAA